MDTAQWPQEIVVKPIEEIVTNNSCPKPAAAVLERKVRPHKEQALNCPRCNSTNTKFCYYNNYSLTQPRYFCKTCRRYWTEGGSLRNIPVGGGSRKNKRSAAIATATVTAAAALPENNPRANQAQDLNLSFQPTCQDFTNNNPKISSAMELLTGMTNSRGLNSFMPMPMPDPSSIYSSGFAQFKPSLNFCVDDHQNGYENGRLFLPFEDLKVQGGAASSSGNGVEQKEQGDSSGFWTGMLNGSGSW